MRIKKWVLSGLVISGLIFCAHLRAEAASDSWGNVEKSKHYIIYYQDAPASYIRQLVREAEGCYKSITEYLGFVRFDFWVWDNRCKIYLYPDAESYLLATGALSWSRGHVRISTKEISTYIGQEMFFDTILPHEIGHIVFREFVGYNKNLPLWLDEGVACMQEGDSKERLATAKCLVSLNLYTHLDDLSKINDSSVIIPFIFYNESASLVDFLLRRFGRNKFVDFCRSLRDAPNWEQSLRAVYRFRNLDDMERLWVDDLTVN
jgi:hypothetical protein